MKPIINFFKLMLCIIIIISPYYINSKPTAVIYRGPAACSNCPGAVADALSSKYNIVYAGPNETLNLQAALATNPQVFIQPGGGDDMKVAWADVKPYRQNVIDYVTNGGHYVGICMGGFLASQYIIENDALSGYGLLGLTGSDAIDYTTTTGADITTNKDFLLNIKWNGVTKQIYFQGGPSFTLGSSATSAQILAYYSNNLIAAMIVPTGKGSVGVVGPHPEGNADWYSIFPGNPQPVTELFIELVDKTCGKDCGFTTTTSSAFRTELSLLLFSILTLIFV